MTTLELYRKHKSGEVSREKFLYEVRRDNNLPFITNLTSYDDAIKILKNKSIVTEGETKEAKADEAVKAEVKAKTSSVKKPKELHIDYANPYEYRHGLQHELAELDEYTDEALEKAKTTVLKNLAKDANFYSNLLNAEKSSYTFKQTETDKPGMQAKADGHLKKEVKKDEKANVQDSLGKKEAGKKKPKGVKVMPDKGVTGSEKTIKESLEEGKRNKYITVDEEGDYSFNDKAVADYLKSVIDPEEIESVDIFMFEDSEGWEETVINGVDYDTISEMSEKDVEELAKQEMSYYLFSQPDEFPGKEMNEIEEVDPNYTSTTDPTSLVSAEDRFIKLMDKYDWYAEMSDDPGKWNTQQSMEGILRQLAKQIGVDRAVELYNQYAPSNRKVTSSHFMREDKHAKIKEALKAALKKEILNPKDILAAKKTGDVVNIPAQDTAAQAQAKNAKLNFRTYQA
jgi:hypothetical protein